MIGIPPLFRAVRLSVCTSLLCVLAAGCTPDQPASAGPPTDTPEQAVQTAAAGGERPGGEQTGAEASGAPAVVPDGGSSPGPEAPPLAAMLDIRGVACQRSEAGVQSCTAPGYDISGLDRACADGDTGFGVVSEEGVTLADRYPAEGATPIATLPGGQFLCVQFVADSSTGGDGWAYVTAIAPEMVDACTDNPVCGAAGLAPAWAGATPPGVCAVGPEGRYTVACPAGWLPRAAIQEFSMGL